jgi:hypothetical protein
VPDAYAAANPMLVTFAGMMGKTGAYGFLRIAIPLFPDPTGLWDWRWVVPVLAVGGILWGALMAIAQRDMKMLVAYSSISHMGFIVLGIFALNVQGQQGAVLQMVNRIVVPALFLIVAWIRTAPARAIARRCSSTDADPRRVHRSLWPPDCQTQQLVGEFTIPAWERPPSPRPSARADACLCPAAVQGAMYAEKPYPSRSTTRRPADAAAPLVALMLRYLAPGVLTALESRSWAGDDRGNQRPTSPTPGRRP